MCVMVPIHALNLSASGGTVMYKTDQMLVTFGMLVL
jgi:hypothetical protein